MGWEQQGGNMDGSHEPDTDNGNELTNHKHCFGSVTQINHSGWVSRV